MAADFVHFNRRDVFLRFPKNPNDPWYSEIHMNSESFGRPQFHTTRAANGPAAEVRAGDTIWLIAQLYTSWGETLPPALDARINVQSCENKQDAKGFADGKGFVYRASPSSRWFKYADLASILPRLQTIRSSDGEENPLLKSQDKSVGRSLQRMRRLSSGELLRNWERQLEAKDSHFISYRLSDGTKCAFTKAKTLAEQGIPFFWDRWSLPRRLAERREASPKEPLDNSIRSAIEEADVVWGIKSPTYGQPGTYSAEEAEIARRGNKYRAVACPTCQRRSKTTSVGRNKNASMMS